jgi:hypothetical protein
VRIPKKRVQKPKASTSSASSSLARTATESAEVSSSHIDPSCHDTILLPFMIDTLAFNRASSMTAPMLIDAVLKEQKHLLESYDRREWLGSARRVLSAHGVFGQLKRSGKVCLHLSPSWGTHAYLNDL